MKKIVSLAGIIVTLMVPFFLILTSARIIFNSFYLDYEYNLPNFPADPYGFTREDRLHWGKLSLAYLFNNQGPEFLSSENLPDGTPLYSEREMSHMIDVKNVIQKALIVWYVISGVLLLAGIFTWRSQWKKEYWRAASRGGWLTILLILAVLLGVAINFDAFFAAFHHLFFTGNSWLFYASDTLIRLFPIKLWSDGFTFTGILTLTGAVLLGLLGGKISRRRG
ncbi:TIGR01906 family membrane protein [bacterium]|nr:TIGR01906 family membrane protein [bacterium]